MRRSRRSVTAGRGSPSWPTSSCCATLTMTPCLSAARDDRRPRRAAPARPHAVAASLRASCAPSLVSRSPDRRPPVVEPRHRRADDRAALRVRHAARPPRVGRRPPDLRAQDPDRPPRRDGHACAWRAASPAFRGARKASTTPSAPRIRRTSISAALGMAVAAKRRARTGSVVAVIGDGAMSAGMAFEALNNAGTMDADLLVVLNDNEMSISRAGRRAQRATWRAAVGALLQHDAARRQGSPRRSDTAGEGAREARRKST